jgi:hypothetical protein
MSVNLNESIRSGSSKRIFFRRFIEGLVLAAALWLFFILVGRVLRKIAVAQITELTNTKIKTESVDFNLDGSVFIKKLVVRPQQEHRYDDAILKAETVYARFSVGSLLLLRPQLKKISVKDFVFNAQYDLDADRWNIAAFKIKVPEGGGGKMPVVSLEKGMLRYSKVSNGQVKSIAAVPIDAEFGPSEQSQSGYSFDITTAERAGFGRSTLTGFWRPGVVTIAGSISSSDVPAFERVWMIKTITAELTYDRNNAYLMKLRIKDLLSRHTPQRGTADLVRLAFLEKFGPFTTLHRFFNRYDPEGQVDIDLEASGNLQQPAGSALRGKIFCKDVSICDRTFPYPVEHLAGPVDFNENSVTLNNLCGRHNNVELYFNGWSKDFGPNWRYEIEVTSDNMVLDSDLYNALTAEQKKFWSAFSPSGLAAIDYHLSRQSQTDKEETLAVELLDTEAVCVHFPYPLKNLTGALFFDSNNVIISDVVSKYDGRKIILNGKVTACSTNRPIYEISVDAENIPLDSTLAEALPDKQRRFYSQFCFTGLADARINIFTLKHDVGPVSFIADVSCKNASMKVNQFPPVVSDVSAKAVFTPDLIRLESLTGRYGQGSVSLTGRIWPEEQGRQPGYCLSLSAERLQLDKDLFALLPEQLEEFASQLQLQGPINLRADLNKAARDNCPDYKLIVDCLGNTVNFERFPYPLKDITGRLTITKDSITLADITATAADNVQITPGTSSIKINGQMTLADGAFDSGLFRLSAEDIFFDERFGIALPEGIQPFYLKLSPTGRFDLSFGNIKISTADDGEKYIGFAGAVKFKDCNFSISPAITELDAVFNVEGLYRIGGGFCDAHAALIADSLKIKGKSLTDLKADINYDPNRRCWLTDDLIADCYDGRLTGRFELTQPHDGPLEYLLQAGFGNIDLKQFLSDAKPEETTRNGLTSGKMNGSLSIRGCVSDNYSRIGRCRLTISNMQVGRLSPMAKLLYGVNLTESKDFAFERMLVDSYIKHNELFLRQLDLSGRAVAFNGSGWIDLQSQNVDLTLTARGRRLATAEPSILQSLTEDLGHAVVKMEVTGSVYDPSVKTTTLPVIEETLGILGTKPAVTE